MTAAPMLPDDASLFAALAPLVSRLAPLVAAAGSPLICSRLPNVYASSSPSEIVTIGLPDGSRREFLLKYERPQPDPEPRLRHGVAYEARVHLQLVDRLPWPTLRCHGEMTFGSPSCRAIVLDHLAGAMRVNEAADDGTLMAAAEWCGRLHGWGTHACTEPSLGFLTRSDRRFHRAWVERAQRIAAEVGGSAEIAAACAAFETREESLAVARPTTLHGEFGPQNVLWREGVVYPVDWESACVGPGVLDLAALLFDWPADTVRHGIEAYFHGRGKSPHAEFGDEFAAATLLTALHWLPQPSAGDNRGWQAALTRLVRAVAAASR